MARLFNLVLHTTNQSNCQRVASSSVHIYENDGSTTSVERSTLQHRVHRASFRLSGHRGFGFNQLRRCSSRRLRPKTNHTFRRGDRTGVHFILTGHTATCYELRNFICCLQRASGVARSAYRLLGAIESDTGCREAPIRRNHATASGRFDRVHFAGSSYFHFHFVRHGEPRSAVRRAHGAHLELHRRCVAISNDY